MHMHPLYTEYHDKGFVLLPTLLPESCREELKEALQQAKDSDFFDETGFGFLGQNAFRKLPAFAHALEQHPIAEYASRLLQSEEVLLFQDLIIWKPPCSKRPNIPPRKVEWHQDYSYWPLSAPKGVTIWIALDESTKENGAIIYISQSHLWGECRATLYTEQESYSEENELPSLDIHNGEKIQQGCLAGKESLSRLSATLVLHDFR